MILASRSPRRADILRQMGVTFEQWVPEVEELVTSEQGPADLVLRNAEIKAEVAAVQHPGRWVLAADTIVVIDGDILGKPENMQAAWAMLGRLSGREHEVYTGVVLCRAHAAEIEKELCRVVTSRVRFRLLTLQEIQRYCEHVDPLDKAGGYGIQERREWIIEEWTGSLTNIMGLPSEELEPHLRQLR